MKKALLISATIIVVAAGCNTAGINSEPGIITAEYLLPDSLLISQFAKSAKVVTLEESPEMMIATIRRVARLDDRFVIWLRTETGASFCIFSQSGAFIRKIGTIGRGPQEIGYPMSFSINRKNNTIDILDRDNNRLHVYDTIGNYVKSVRFNFFFDDFTVTNDGNYIFHSPIISKADTGNVLLDPGAYLFNPDGKYLKPMFTIERNNTFHIYGSNSFLSAYPNAMLMSSLDDNVYSFSADTAVTEFFLDFGTKTWSQSLRDEYLPSEGPPMDYIFARVFPHATSRYIYFLSMFAEPGQAGISLIDKKEMTCHIYAEVHNDMTNEKVTIAGSSETEFFGYATVVNQTGTDQEMQLHIFQVKQ